MTQNTWVTRNTWMKRRRFPEAEDYGWFWFVIYPQCGLKGEVQPHGTQIKGGSRQNNMASTEVKHVDHIEHMCDMHYMHICAPTSLRAREGNTRVKHDIYSWWGAQFVALTPTLTHLTSFPSASAVCVLTTKNLVNSSDTTQSARFCKRLHRQKPPKNEFRINVYQLLWIYCEVL